VFKGATRKQLEILDKKKQERGRGEREREREREREVARKGTDKCQGADWENGWLPSLRSR